MATTPIAKTPSIAIARALRRLGLTQGKGNDFRVEGEYKNGDRVCTYVLLLTPHAEESVAARADDIERWAAGDGGWDFTVNVRYSTNGRPHCTISNGAVEKVREEPPAPPATQAAPEPQPQPVQPAGETAVLEDAVQPEEEERPPAGEVPQEEAPQEEAPPSKGSLTITHTRADGTLLDGSRKGDGAFELVKPFGFKPFRSLGVLGIRHSRDREAQKWRIDCAAAALREAGWEVTVEIDETERRSFAEAEAERLERAEDRTERFSNRAGRAAAASEARHKAAHRALDGIEPGQPILRGHHSERGHRRAIERSDSHMRKSIEEHGKAEHYTHRAQAAGKYEERRYDPNRTRRRLEKLRAELRQQERYRDEETAAGRDPGRYERRIEDLNEEITAWEAVVEKARQDGVKLWEADDFAPGDFAMYSDSGSWYQVKRVNPKTLSIAWNLRLAPKQVMTLEDATERGNTWTFGMDYTNVKARCPEAAMLAFLAEGKVPGTKSAWAAHEAQPASEVRAVQAAKPKPKPKAKRSSDPKVAKRVYVECPIGGAEATLTWLNGNSQPHKDFAPVRIEAGQDKFHRSVWSRALQAEIARVLAERGYEVDGADWTLSRDRSGFVRPVKLKKEPQPAAEPPAEESPAQESEPLVDVPAAPAEEPPAAEEPAVTEPEQPVDEPAAPDEEPTAEGPAAAEPEPPAAEPQQLVDEPAEEPPAPEPSTEEPPAAEPEPPAGEPAEDPRELRLQRQQAKALGWSAGHADLATAAAAGQLYWHTDGTLRQQELPGTAGRAVALHRMTPLVKAGFLTVGAADRLNRRPVRVTPDGRRAVMVWKRWRPKPVAMNREEECEKLRPLLGGEQERRLAEQAREEEAKRKAASKAFWAAQEQLVAWEDRQDRMWKAWATVHNIRFRLQRLPAGWVPTEEEIEQHRLDPDVVAELRAEAENPQPRPKLPSTRAVPLPELPPMAADEETPEQLDLFASA
ncbi:DUF3560 domain-containing protein [Streptomyces sp. NPDC019990]|uniref:DUF3560 domain-containing protein n=1 Tax=Streptomyces sp. NPDC019990 TaxID=3154693 RepID=UPI0033C0C258